jgi:hypothetical protein
MYKGSPQLKKAKLRTLAKSWNEEGNKQMKKGMKREKEG